MVGSMIKKIILTVAFFFFPITAFSTPPIYGPLQTQNNFSEIKLNGTQSTAEINLFGYTIVLGGNFSTTGGYPLSFTLTGSTTLTLPTSGTLATTANQSFTNPTFTGTVTGPDSSTWTSSGMNNLYALGVGESAPIAGYVNISGEYEVAGF